MTLINENVNTYGVHTSLFTWPEGFIGECAARRQKRKRKMYEGMGYVCKCVCTKYGFVDLCMCGCMGGERKLRDGSDIG